MAERDRILFNKERGDEKIKVEVTASPVTGECFSIGEDVLRKAGWTDDPGVGKAVILPDGREVLSPIPMAPPVGYVAQPTLMELLDTMVKRHLLQLKGDDEIDSPEEYDDFDVEDEVPDPFSIYEMVDLIPESPALPKAAPVSEPSAPLDPSAAVAPATDATGS